MAFLQRRLVMDPQVTCPRCQHRQPLASPDGYRCVSCWCSVALRHMPVVRRTVPHGCGHEALGLSYARHRERRCRAGCGRGSPSDDRREGDASGGLTPGTVRSPGASGSR